MVISAIVTSIVIWARILWVRSNQPPFEGYEFFEGGLAIIIIWLALYSIIYIVTTFITASLFKKGKFKLA